MPNSPSPQDTRPVGEERERRLLCLLQRAWTYSFTTKADYARLFADEIAEATSRSFMTTIVIPGRELHGRLWKITPEGLAYLWANAAAIADEEVANYVEEYTEG